MRVVGDEDFVDIPVDYKVLAYYKVRELTALLFSKKGKQAHELVTKVLLPTTASTCSCSKFERVFICAITEGISISWPFAILHRFLKVSKHMVL